MFDISLALTISRVPEYVCTSQELYSHLSSMLSERGIDNQFARSLLEFSTVLEHHHYIAFLEKMRSFVKQK